jgi:signal transduction histidine kinase
MVPAVARAYSGLVTAPRFFTEPIRLRTWKETGYSLISLPAGVVWFCVLCTLLVVSVSTFFLLGVPLLVGTLLLASLGARAERGLSRVLLDQPIQDRPRRDYDWSKWRDWLKPLADLGAWRELLYLMLLFPFGLVLFIVAVVCWSVAVSFLTAPIWWFAIPEDNRGDFLWPGNKFDNPFEWVLTIGGGLLLLLLTPWIIRGLVAAHKAVMRGLLGPTRRELEKASERLAAQRDLAVSSASGDRRQIERDLHDGAQARLVSLAVDLGRARRRLEEGGSTDEAAELVRVAHEDAKQALVEIRALARGIHPAVLTDRGLDAALSALAARSPVPVSLATEIGERPSEAVEAAAYFVVSEALANVARHSGAERAAVSVVRAGGILVVEVRDDGEGGASPNGGSGLIGLEERVGALGGTLVVESPPGGPTSITAVIPCE